MFFCSMLYNIQYRHLPSFYHAVIALLTWTYIDSSAH